MKKEILKFDILTIEELLNLKTKSKNIENNIIDYLINNRDTFTIEDKISIKLYFRFIIYDNEYIDMKSIEILKDDKNFNQMFIERHYDIFKLLDFRFLLFIINFDEFFLENNYKMLNNYDLFSKQKFSEDFYIKHFSEFKYYSLSDCLNEWKFSKNMSNKLKMFLKLNAIK